MHLERPSPPDSRRRNIGMVVIPDTVWLALPDLQYRRSDRINFPRKVVDPERDLV